MITSKDSTNLGTSETNERTTVILVFRTSYKTQQHFVGLKEHVLIITDMFSNQNYKLYSLLA